MNAKSPFRVLMLLALLATAVPVTGRGASSADLFGSGKFFIGCNYWAKHAGMYMWRDWRPDVVEAELAALAKNGVEIMRVFPLWPDFQPLTRVHACGNRPAGFLQNNGPFANPAGVDEEMMRRFRWFCDCARKNDIRIIVGLVTGWMSGRMFVPPAFDNANVLTDPESIMWESRFVRHFVREMKAHPAIVAWDFGNECNCMGKGTMAEFYNWMNIIGLEIRLADASRPVVSGLHGCSTKPTAMAPIRNVAELSDILCTHPYSFYVPGCAADPLGTFRPTLHPTAESLLYRDIGGKPCFIEEIGNLGASCNSDERTAAAVRATLYCAWANDLKGLLWWCNSDQEGLRFPPYDWTCYERELGMLRQDYSPKPVMREMKAFRDFLKTLPFDRLPPRQSDSVIVVPERTDGWISGFGAYLLARQAGLDPVFAGAEHDLPESKLYVVCSAMTDGEAESYTYTAQRRVFEKAKEGATVLVLYSGDSRFTHLRETAGLEPDYGTKSPIVRTFALPARPGRTMTCRDATTVRLRAAGCEILSATSDGEPVFTRFKYGRGTVLLCNSPIDREAIARTDALTGEEPVPFHLFLEEAKRWAGVRRVVEKINCPGVVLTEHPTADGATIVVAVNCDTRPADCALTVAGEVTDVWRGEIAHGRLRLKADEAAVFKVSRANGQ